MSGADKYLGLLKRYLDEYASSGDLAPDEVYSRAVESLVDVLLRENPEEVLNDSEIPDELKGPIRPEDLGKLYEYWRGFRPSRTSGALVQCIKSRRNQGLFYTPERIVKFIVERTLDHLESNGSDLINVRLCDPAVGTGAFLDEALNALASRIQRNDGTCSACTEEIRTHIVRNCLFGVDLDPVAVKIARAVLYRSIGQPNSGITPNIRVGNTLIGRLDSHEKRRQGSLREIPENGTEFLNLPDAFHWPAEFPEVFSPPGNGFDAVIGNPPYEIVSVKESGIASRSLDQAFFRKTYETCSGKINTYRLMMERGLQLLREGGILGYIVPATLLADSTAEALRNMVFNRTTVLHAVVIPEKARVFSNVTQALLILITRKGGRTESLKPAFWDGIGPIPETSRVSISRKTIGDCGCRVPLVRASRELTLLEKISLFPPLGGNDRAPSRVSISQGEVNVSVHRKFITAHRTDYPLIRGEHVLPLAIEHPAPSGDRLDWVEPELAEKLMNGGAASRRTRGTPWDAQRIVVGRVVNMDSARRLKAALAPKGVFLGDMTNSIVTRCVPLDYLLGVLNSRLLNWRFKLTSTNNYISARELESLPVPMIDFTAVADPRVQEFVDAVRKDLFDREFSLMEIVEVIDAKIRLHENSAIPLLLGGAIQTIVKDLQAASPENPSEAWNVLDAFVLLLYDAQKFGDLLT
ncbi:Eco57I restriction-modification methylase domain-containing protein [Desulfomonile tiedjei]|uniref:site-specific DNA-methyltransferase (adenine-specific) n=1 Tax=Desulfomonile tiedjei (strain ATCC 49306 / DSM 6799 / DCB-1) TaxID=706587 RepID=I4CAK0_DESTA|nr:N-6 DNA methylase [Desulfomonile tiedjei]AFM26591.1 type I restriction-modification system methyltransferase subunit [Desulfomonile tiedjei DSM 6799]